MLKKFGSPEKIKEIVKTGKNKKEHTSDIEDIPTDFGKNQSKVKKEKK